jgi:chaperonin GroEL (HSP60 family)
VVQTALQDAASVARLLVTTEAMAAEKPDKTGSNVIGAPAEWAISDPYPRASDK